MTRNRIFKILLFLVVVLLISVAAFLVLAILGQQNTDLILTRPR
jgi:NADH:ubiquinone oxidoreductase subunit 3 (subunit A)